MTPSRRAISVTIVTCEYPPFPGGIGTYSGQLARSLKKSGCRLTVCAPQYAETDVPDIIVHGVLGHHRISPKALVDLLLVLRRRHPEELILAADIRSVIALYLLKPLLGLNYRAMVHGSEAAKFDAGSPKFRLARRAYRAATEVLFNSRATQDIFESGFGALAHSRVTYLGVEDFWFAPPDPEFDHPELRAIRPNTQVVCSVGRVEPRKGHIGAIRALAGAGKTIAPLTYVVAGHVENEKYMTDIRQEAERNSVNIIQTGRLTQRDVRRLYSRSACQLLLASSLHGKTEGFGLVLLEAAAQYCPTIATRSGGIPEVLGEAGVLLNDSSPDTVLPPLLKLLTDADERRAAGEAAHARSRKFTWDRCAELTFPESRTSTPFAPI